MTATSAALTATRLLPLVDRADFRTLFIEELGWDNPDQPPRSVTVEDSAYTLTQVAGFKGMRIWHCPNLPGRRIQRVIDQAIAKDNLERLVIFTSDTEQEWRWPRRAQTGGVNAKLLVHAHEVGEDDKHLVDQLEAITIDFDADPTLVEVLSRMRSAFDVEAEAASVAAARLMARLYNALDASTLHPTEATLLLARLLFLLFGDDSGMWRTNMFRDWLATHTSETTLHVDLADLFDVLNTPEKQRSLPAGSPLTDFRYVNGDLYHDDLQIPLLTENFRTGLLDACDFDWSLISPAIFGSMFQVVKDQAARREGGEHYTTEENILKTLNPLFLDELHDRLDQAWNDKGQLTRLHNDLGRVRLMDPACGCGNFLIVAYRELRAIELEILKRRRDLDEADANWARSQMTTDVTGDMKVTLDHFYGIEIEEWPARIAETAMLLVDHLANQTMEEEFGIAPDRLPIKLAPTIVHGNALRMDWSQIFYPSPNTLIVGNPPFIGQKEKSSEQISDMKLVWGKDYDGYLDYVTGWYKKASDYFTYVRKGGRFAFVSTNSIAQGQPVPALFKPLFDAGWRIRFAHQTFAWTSEAPGAAAVHCVIVGFDKHERTPPVLYTYEHPKATPVAQPAATINAYLLDAPHVFVEKRMKPLSQAITLVTSGSTAFDWGYLTIDEDSTGDNYKEVYQDEIARKYLRRYMGGEEMINGIERWCLWLKNAEPSDIKASPVLRRRVSKVRELRSASKRPGTLKAASYPHLFGEDRQPKTAYLGIPQTFSEHRLYATAGSLSADVIANKKLFTVEDPDGFLFAVVSSSIFLAWQKAVGGRLKSDPSFSNTVVWNNLPLPAVSERVRAGIIEAGESILEARALHPERSLADHYNPLAMDPTLIAAHDRLDRLVDRAFGARRALSTHAERQALLFKRYAELTQLT